MKKITCILTSIIVLFSCNSEDKNVLLNQQINCSAELPDFKVTNLVDTLPNTSWNAGSAGKHSVNVNLDKAHSVKKIMFVLGSTPQTNTNVNVLVKKGSNGTYENIYSKSMITNQLDTVLIEKEIDDVSSIQLHIENPVSWISVIDLKAIGK